ncbi:MAG TPA: sigma-70 family RNA polymerase sigma factor [Anaerolineae bacterium]|nr:sigma-70 family RNA polymerase sigma factor [Anaerolineae bacterium]
MSTTEQQELQWIAAARRGDRNAFSKLVQAYQIPVYNLTYRMLGNAQEAEDAAQEAFLRAYKRLSTYQPDKKFSNWILSIASHYCIDLLRRRRFQWLSIDDDPTMEWLSSDEEQPDDAALRGERAEEVRALLERIEPNYRAPLVLRYWHDLSYREIAGVLNLTEPAVKTRLHRARLQMAALLEEQAPAAVQPLAARSPESAAHARASGPLHATAQPALAA